MKRALKRSRTVLIAYHILDNWRTKRRYAAGRLELESGSTHQDLGLDESLEYIQTVFQDYLRYAGLTEADLQGKRILEIGPGDNLGVALRFLAAGAAQVVALDRFYAPRDAKREAAIYEALRASLTAGGRGRFDGALRLADGAFMIDGQRLRIVHGLAIEDAARQFTAESFDLILSRAVLEHLFDPDGALRAMDFLLAPGGVSSHKVDFRDHGMFGEYGHHPLEFLTVASGPYRLMTRDSGKPNRRLQTYFCEAFRRTWGPETTWITHIVGRDAEFLPHIRTLPVDGEDRARARDLVAKIRPRLARAFRGLSDEELSVQGIFVTARKSAR